MWEFFHLFLGVSTASPGFYPGPGSNVSYRVLSSALSDEKVFRLAGVMARQLEFENAKHSKRLFSESTDGNYWMKIKSEALD